MEELTVLIYFVIGILFTVFYSSTINNINDPNNESGMVNMYFAIITLFWPIYFIKYIFSIKSK
jgi:Na+-driven multidrug efflux pump